MCTLNCFYGNSDIRVKCSKSEAFKNNSLSAFFLPQRSVGQYFFFVLRRIPLRDLWCKSGLKLCKAANISDVVQVSWARSSMLFFFSQTMPLKVQDCFIDVCSWLFIWQSSRGFSSRRRWSLRGQGDRWRCRNWRWWRHDEIFAHVWIFLRFNCYVTFLIQYIRNICIVYSDVCDKLLSQLLIILDVCGRIACTKSKHFKILQNITWF